MLFLCAGCYLKVYFGVRSCGKFTRQADSSSNFILCLGKNETIYNEKLCLGVDCRVCKWRKDGGVSFYSK